MIACAVRRVLSLLILSAVLGAAQAGTLSEATFSSYTPLSSNLELARRLLSPLAAARIPELLARSDAALRAQPVDLSKERFALYVPSRTPPHGYALLVFVPPWRGARLPDGWATVLDRDGIIFVSAARSGNDASVLGRRDPLALLAEQNVVRRYPVDPDRIYIAGFSGGSRVAMRLALGYPDVFRGALLDAGSDPIGDSNIPLPPKDLFWRFQEASRLVYLTGADDLPRLGMAAVSMQSMRDWCVFDIHAEVAPHTAHDVADPAALSRALNALFHPVPPAPDRLAACRSAVDGDLTAKFQKAESLMAGGHRGAARDLLNDIDRRFGGLAAPRSVALAAELAKD